MQVASHLTAIPLGRGSPTRLGATYPPTPRTASTLAYLVLLRAEIARFTQQECLSIHIDSSLLL